MKEPGKILRLITLTSFVAITLSAFTVINRDQFEKQKMLDYGTVSPDNWLDLAQPTPIDHPGLEAFQNNCKPCHRLDTKLVGPALRGAFARNDSIRFVRIIVSTLSNAHATHVFNEYDRLRNPDVKGLSKKQLTSERKKTCCRVAGGSQRTTFLQLRTSTQKNLNMKYPVLTTCIVASLLALYSACQPKKTIHFDAETFTATYLLPVPGQWTTERMSIPIEFAPSIPYAGIEELRFAPGWDNSESEEYWTYCYLWYLDGKHQMDAGEIGKNLQAYYTGLVGRNIDKRKIPGEKLIPVKTAFDLIRTHEGDLGTFKGSVEMLDYMAQQPIKLNCVVHVKECPGKNNTFVFYEISPQEDGHPVWNTLNKIWSEFQCDVD